VNRKGRKVPAKIAEFSDISLRNFAENFAIFAVKQNSEFFNCVNHKNKNQEEYYAG